MLDETIITETPPLYSCYGHIGEQVRVPITGNRAKRILHGAINVRSGDVGLLITEEWTKGTHQGSLSMIRARWRGWNIVLFEDRASQHTAPDSRAWAAGLGIEIRLLQGDAGAERDGPLVEAHEAGGGGRPVNRDGHPLGPRCVPAHHRPDTPRSAASGGDPVGGLLADEVAGLCKDFWRPT
jgi:hypothetical protein